jgi:methionyl aminopeptidase
MPVVTKTPQQIEMMRRAAQVAARIVAQMRTAAKPGVTTLQLDQLAERELAAAGAASACKGYPTFQPGEGFPGNTSISVNDEVLHASPRDRALQAGDVVKIDLPVSYNGWFASKAITVPVGAISAEDQRLVDVTAAALRLAISMSAPGRRWSQVAAAMHKFVRDAGCDVIKEFVGHGIGRKLHEDPKVPSFSNSLTVRDDFRLRPGMTIAIDVVVVVESAAVDLLADNWTVASKNGKNGAQFRDTIAMTGAGADVLTQANAAAT